MTNTAALKDKILQMGITFSFLASKIGISRESLYNKINNKSNFKANEIATTVDVLQLSQKETNNIFFAN